jgi:hypothetical protein
MDREFRPPQDVTHLRTIAVGDNDVPAVFDHVGDAGNGEPRRFVLIGNCLMILIADKRVAANRDHRELAVRPHDFCSPPVTRYRSGSSDASAVTA